jgi:hypothetical protein
MKLNDLFGELSPFEIIVSISGLIGGGFAIFNIIRSRLLPARVQLKIADTVDLVLGTDGIITSFHLACVFENQGAKTGIVQRMKAIVRDPKQRDYHFTWKLFFGYAPGGTRREPVRDRHAIPVNADDTAFEFIQFDQDQDQNFVELGGEYLFRIFAWVNAETVSSDPDSEIQFRATVPEKLVRRVGPPPKKPTYWTLAINDWT